jgi:hypothetical protein
MSDNGCGGDYWSDLWSCDSGILGGIGNLWSCYLGALGSFWGSDCLGGLGSICGSKETKKIELTGKEGEEVKVTYRVHNRSFQTVKMTVTVPAALKAGDSTVELADLKADPAQLELGPWQSRKVTVSATLTADLVAGTEYSCDVETWRRTQLANLVVKRTA